MDNKSWLSLFILYWNEQDKPHKTTAHFFRSHSVYLTSTPRTSYSMLPLYKMACVSPCGLIAFVHVALPVRPLVPIITLLCRHLTVFPWCIFESGFSSIHYMESLPVMRKMSLPLLEWNSKPTHVYIILNYFRKCYKYNLTKCFFVTCNMLYTWG